MCQELFIFLIIVHSDTQVECLYELKFMSWRFFDIQQLTLIIPDFQTRGRCYGRKHHWHTFLLVVFTAEVHSCLAIAVQGSRVSPFSQQSLHHVCLMGDHCQMKRRLGVWVRQRNTKKWIQVGNNTSAHCLNHCFHFPSLDNYLQRQNGPSTYTEFQL